MGLFPLWFSAGTVVTPGNHPLRTGVTGGNSAPADAFVFGQGSLTGGNAGVMEGYLDDWRLTAGVSRYRGAVAPLPTAAFPITTAQRVETIPERKASKVVTNIGSVVRPIGSGDPYWDAVSLYMDFNTTPFEDQSNNTHQYFVIQPLIEFDQNRNQLFTIDEIVKLDYHPPSNIGKDVVVATEIDSGFILIDNEGNKFTIRKYCFSPPQQIIYF